MAWCVMDLKEYYFQNVQEEDFHYRFYSTIKDVNKMYNIFMGELEVNDYKFEVFDAEEAIIKFRELCQPDVNFDKEKTCWFILITYYLYSLGYEIREFPRLLARPPMDPTEFTYNDIRNKIIANGDDDNGTVRYATRRRFVASLTFVIKNSHVEVSGSKEQKYIDTTNISTSFSDMNIDEKHEKKGKTNTLDGCVTRIEYLINKIDYIEGLFYKDGGYGRAVSEHIHDVPEYQEWIQEVIYELGQIFQQSNDSFIWEAMNLAKRKNSHTEKVDFLELKGKLKTIKRNLQKYYPDIYGKTEMNNETENKDMPKKNAKIFISHSSKDVEYVKKIVNLLDGMGLNNTQVFCSSIPGYGIPIGKDIFEYLREQYEKYDLHVFIIHSINYYNSPISLNEMGAAWVLRNEATSILLPGFGYTDMKGIVGNREISIKLDEGETALKDRLNQLYDKITNEFDITKKADIIWEQKRDTFIKEIRELNI